MFKYLINGLLAGIGIKLLDNYRRLSFQLLKIEATKFYMYGVQMARLTAVSLMRMGLAVSLICVGILLMHAGLFVLLPWTAKDKAVLGILLGLVYVVIGGIALIVSVNEKRWMRKSGVVEMLDQVTDQSDKA